MTRKMLPYKLLLTLILVVMSASAFGQLQKRVNFSINTPFALRMGNYLLPPGKYVLHQVLPNDPNLFALHPENLTKEPIAMIRTVRIEYPTNRTPSDTKLFVDLEEAGVEPQPVLEGWVIPGTDGWEVVGVVEKKSGALTKWSAGRGHSAKKHRLDRTRLTFDKYDTKDKRSKIQFEKIEDQ
jgi:hypothetical protein